VNHPSRLHRQPRHGKTVAREQQIPSDHSERHSLLNILTRVIWDLNAALWVNSQLNPLFDHGTTTLRVVAVELPLLLPPMTHYNFKVVSPLPRSWIGSSHGDSNRMLFLETWNPCIVLAAVQIQGMESQFLYFRNTEPKAIWVYYRCPDQAQRSAGSQAGILSKRYSV